MPLSALLETSEDGLGLRPATMADAPALRAWRNDPETIKASRNTAPVRPDEHLGWLAALLKSPDRQLFIVMASGKPCGQIRLDTMGDGVELSWTIAPECRRRGYARQMLSRVVRALPEMALTAWIKPENRSSIRAAEAAGFRLAETRSGYLKYVANAAKDL